MSFKEKKIGLKFSRLLEIFDLAENFAIANFAEFNTH